MVNVRLQPVDPAPGDARFKLLMTQDRPRGEEHWTVQFPRFMGQHGVAAYLAHSGREAIDLTDRLEFHAAVVDLATPTGDVALSPSDGGLWLLELLRRMPAKPPIVVITSPAYGQRQLERLLSEALRLGAFAVLNKPIHLEQLLAVFQKVMDRQYRGTWPS